VIVRGEDRIFGKNRRGEGGGRNVRKTAGRGKVRPPTRVAKGVYPRHGPDGGGGGGLTWGGGGCADGIVEVKENRKYASGENHQKGGEGGEKEKASAKQQTKKRFPCTEGVTSYGKARTFDIKKKKKNEKK